MTVIRGGRENAHEVHLVHPVHLRPALDLPVGPTGAPPPQLIDIEALVSWAVRRSGALPWVGVRPRELMFDQGFTAKARRKPHVDWLTAEACAGIAVNGRAPRSMRSPGPDGARVLMAIGVLDDPGAAALVLACGRAGVRPDWMPGVEPRKVPKTGYAKTRRGRRAHRKSTIMVWEPCAPEGIRAAREAYRRWHNALRRLAAQLAGSLDGWEISEFAVPEEPWRAP